MSLLPMKREQTHHPKGAQSERGTGLKSNGDVLVSEDKDKTSVAHGDSKRSLHAAEGKREEEEEAERIEQSSDHNPEIASSPVGTKQSGIESVSPAAACSNDEDPSLTIRLTNAASSSSSGDDQRGQEPAEDKVNGGKDLETSSGNQAHRDAARKNADKDSKTPKTPGTLALESWLDDKLSVGRSKSRGNPASPRSHSTPGNHDKFDLEIENSAIKPKLMKKLTIEEIECEDEEVTLMRHARKDRSNTEVMPNR